MDDDDRRSAGEDRPWERLPREEAYPPDLEARTVERLRAEGRFDRTQRLRPAWAAAAALSAVAFAAGWLARAVPGPAWRPAHPRFALLLYEGPGFDAGTPGAHAAEYGAWARRLRAAGVPVSGEELAPAAAAVPSPVSGEEPTGFFLIEAPDVGEAARIARSCPHVAHGGRVVVRPVAPA